MLLLQHTHWLYSWSLDARANTIFGMNSRVQPKYKTKSHVGNWPEYQRALVQRGDVTLGSLRTRLTPGHLGRPADEALEFLEPIEDDGDLWRRRVRVVLVNRFRQHEKALTVARHVVVCSTLSGNLLLEVSREQQLWRGRTSR